MMVVGYAVYVHGIKDPVAAFKHKSHAERWSDELYHGRARLEQIRWDDLAFSKCDDTLRDIPITNREQS